ncbi:MAG TPA: hypothetical protein VJO53_00830 [Candidatus Acidoferrales bacterium]|nr:hypothetical protein [Candidatus Acidoferrales bacterium]
MLGHLSKRSYIAIAVVGTLLLAAVATLGASAWSSRRDPVTVPDLTAIHVTLNNTVASNQSRPGDHFEATVSQPIVVDGKTVIPEGAQATGLVVDAHHSGRLRGRARLQLALETVRVNGSSYQIHTASDVRVGGKHKKRNLVLIGGGAGGGALIGAIAAGGKGALIGGPVGAGAGTAVAFFTGKKDVRLRAETPLTFRLAQPVAINVKS